MGHAQTRRHQAVQEDTLGEGLDLLLFTVEQDTRRHGKDRVRRAGFGGRPQGFDQRVKKARPDAHVAVHGEDQRVACGFDATGQRWSKSPIGLTHQQPSGHSAQGLCCPRLQSTRPAVVDDHKFVSHFAATELSQERG